MTVGPPKRYLMALGACRRWRDVPCSRASRSLQILHPYSGCREQWDGSQLSNDGSVFATHDYSHLPGRIPGLPATRPGCDSGPRQAGSKCPMNSAADSLEKNRTRALSENLAMVLDTEMDREITVAPGEQIGYQIELDAQRFEGTSDGQSQLVATW
jgi:ABC-type transport auxiliary lipoprotein component